MIIIPSTMSKILRKISDWGNETIHIPGWIIFGLFVFVFPMLIIIAAWTMPTCKSENQNQCLINIPNVRIYFSLIGLAFPSMIGILYLRFRSMYKSLDKDTNEIQKSKTE